MANERIRFIEQRLMAIRDACNRAAVKDPTKHPATWQGTVYQIQDEAWQALTELRQLKEETATRDPAERTLTSRLREDRCVHIAGYPIMSGNYYMRAEWADILEPLDMPARVQAYIMLTEQEKAAARERACQAIAAVPAPTDPAERR